MSDELDLQLAALRARYSGDPESARGVLQAAHAKMLAGPPAAFIHKRPWEDVAADLSRVLERRAKGEDLPLFSRCS